jgi:hypothetical protein
MHKRIFADLNAQFASLFLSCRSFFPSLNLETQKRPTMRLKPLFSLFFMSALALACASPCRVIWTEGPTNSETGKAVHTMEIQNPPKGTDWTLWFCQFRTPVNILEGEGRIEHLGGTLYRVAPGADTKGDPSSSATKPGRS